MFDKAIMIFVFICIFILIIINLMIFLTTVILTLKENRYERKYQKEYRRLYPYVFAYIQNEAQFSGLEKQIAQNSHFAQKVVMDILLKYTEKHHVNLSAKFVRLGLNKLLTEKVQKEADLESMRALGLSKIPKAFDILMHNTESKDFEIKYVSFYSLSLLDVDKNQRDIYINKLIKSGIQRDRIIEMVRNLRLNVKEYIDYLEKQEEDIGKVIFIRVLENYGQVLSEAEIEKVVPFIQESKEVKIAAVLTLSSTKQKRCLDILIELYYKESEWEVRSAIAKSMVRDLSTAWE